jgi:hypothetical protein
VAVEIMSYAESRGEPRDTVYGYVPVELVDQLIEAHGGMVDTLDGQYMIVEEK